MSGSPASAAAAEPVADSVAPYRKVFASYSRRDEAIVQQLESYARAFGDEYLRDVTTLRAGERWDERITRLIEEADVFQLFWSWNAMQSDYVQREWRHALSLRRHGFVRPLLRLRHHRRLRRPARARLRPGNSRRSDLTPGPSSPHVRAPA